MDLREVDSSQFSEPLKWLVDQITERIGVQPHCSSYTHSSGTTHQEEKETVNLEVYAEQGWGKIYFERPGTVRVTGFNTYDKRKADTIISQYYQKFPNSERYVQ